MAKATNVDVSHCKRLSDKNYPTWKKQVTVVMKFAKILGVVDGTTLRPVGDPDAEEAWDDKDIQAQAIILPLLDERNMSHVYNCNSAHQLWEKLSKIHSDSSQLNKSHTMAKFFNYKIKDNDSIVDAYTEMEELARSLEQMGLKVEDEMVVSRIVEALPKGKFNAFKKSWDSDADKTMGNLYARLKKEELELSNGDEETESNNAAAYSAQRGGSGHQFKRRGNSNSNGRDKKKDKCNYCGKIGHWQRECRTFLRETKSRGQNRNSRQGEERHMESIGSHHHQGRRDETPRQSMHHINETRSDSFHETDEPANAFVMIDKEDKRDVWFSDSGATCHITGRDDWFIDYYAFDNPSPVFLSDNNEVHALGKGKVGIEALINGKWIDCTIDNVLYIPGAVNLFSESIMAHEKGYTIVRTKNRTIYYKNEKEGPSANYHSKMYVMNFRLRHMSMFAYICKEVLAENWHARCGHLLGLRQSENP